MKRLAPPPVAPSDDVARPSDRRGVNGSTRITPKVAFGDAVAGPADDLGFADISMDLPLPMSAMNSNKRNSATSTTCHTRGPTAANNPLSVSQGGNAHAPDSDPDSSESGDDDDEPEAPPTNFEMNSFTLMFTDAAAERGYVRFITGQAYFAAGKLYAAIGSFILLALILPYLRWHPTWAGLTNGFILFLLGSVTAGFVCFGLMFLSTAPRWREVLFTIVLATHWLSFGTATVRAKQDGVNRYAITTLCLFYCFFLAQPRFILMVVFLMIMSTAAVATVTFGSAGYFDSHSHFEILYWPLLIALFPIHILRQFERRSRAAFEASETTRAFLGGLARRTKAMHRIIARSYPVAAATRLLQSHGAEQYALYPSTALIVTDVQGFTAWAAVTSNDAVVEGISKMFIAMEKAAMKFAVEKIATVGDSFVGAVFPPPQSAATANGTGAAGELDTAMRCHRMFRFANAVVRNPKSMAVRVGVHVGDVMGGFVGLQPPKFDVFGSGIQVAQELETTGRPKHIHASNAAVEAASALGFRSEDSEVTPQGTVFAAWRLQDPRTHAAAAAQMAADTRSVEEDAMQLCALVARSSEALYQRTMRQGDTRDEVTRKRLRTLAAAAAQTRARIPRGDGDQQLLHLTTDDLAASTPMDDFAGSSINKFAASVLVRAGSADADADDETSSTVLTTPATVVAEDDVSNMFGFSYVTLKFDDAEAEADYARWYLATGLPTAIFTTLTYMMVYLLAAHVCVACTHSVRNKLAVVVAVAISLGYLHFLREKGTAHGHNPKLAIGVYVSVTFAMGLLYEPGCADVVNERAPENSIMTMGLLCPVAAMLCLELRFFVRIAIHALMCGSLYVLVQLRHVVYGHDEGVLVFDVYPAAVFAALALMSYFTDFNLRLAFQDASRQSAVEAFARSSADLCNAGLEMLLPSFVVERLVGGMDGAIDDLAVGGPPRDRTSTADERRSLLGASRDSSRPSIGSATPNHGADSSGTRTPLTARSSELLSTTTNALWPFPRAVVVFVSFTPPPGAAFEYEVVRDTVARIEVAARARGLQKVKTIGTMVLLVAGADGDGSGESVAQQQQRVTETAINAAEAALEIRRGTFVNTGLSSAGWKLRVGLHTGPIFGAVIGSQGLCFDIYGDTVNTASRMCTTATADAAGSGGHAVQCSEGFHDLLPREAMSAGMVGFATARRAEPVAVKGKGLMTVYAITEHSAAAAERLKTPANTTTRRVTAAPLVLPNPSHHDVHPDEVSPLTFHGTPLEAGGGVAAPAV